MDSTIVENQTVKELLETRPHLIHLFIQYKLDCPGCRLQRFCTLKDAANYYQLQPDQFIHQLSLADQSNIEKEHIQ